MAQVKFIEITETYSSVAEQDLPWYALQPDSPAVNAGTDVGVDTDIEGNPRDVTPDIGASEKV